jgi:hypothetical protein
MCWLIDYPLRLLIDPDRICTMLIEAATFETRQPASFR